MLFKKYWAIKIINRFKKGFFSIVVHHHALSAHYRAIDSQMQKAKVICSNSMMNVTSKKDIAYVLGYIISDINKNSLWYQNFNIKLNFAYSRPSASNFKNFSRSLEQFFLTVGQKSFGNKIENTNAKKTEKGNSNAC